MMIVDFLEKFGLPILLAYIAYLLGNRGKRVEVDIEKVKELNTVLSDMLNTWHYLLKLSDVLSYFEAKEDKLIFPREYLPFLALRSGLLNDVCFRELDENIKLLKRYDAVSYFELEGLGKRYDYFKSVYVMPYLQSHRPSDFGNGINRQFMDRLLNEIEEHLRETAKKISRDTAKKIDEKIAYLANQNSDEEIQNLNLEFYEVMINIMPESIEKPSFEEFAKMTSDPEVKEVIIKQFSILAKGDMDKVIAIIMNNPNLTMEEVESILSCENTV
ncbi:hypothetical protein ACLI1A_12535 [Flavobacterium sp. RHBU_3]|uniref:hypothetical protein n=1 Tax=Flavobacterium sp. RHBU_3 TaxID=3391184 RepID=UPI003984AEA6